MIDTLSPEQEKRLIECHASWRAIGLATHAAETDPAHQTIIDLYEAHTLPPPPVLMFDSPLQCNLALHILKNDLRSQERDNLKERIFAPYQTNRPKAPIEGIWTSVWSALDNLEAENVWGDIGNTLSSHMRQELEESLSEDFEDGIEDDLWDHLEEELYDALNITLNFNVWHKLRDRIGKDLNGYAYTSTDFLGSLDAFWVAFYTFGEELGIQYKCKAQLSAYRAYVKSCGPGYFYQNIAIASKRPKLLKLGTADMLDHSDGSAVEFCDGYAVTAPPAT